MKKVFLKGLIEMKDEKILKDEVLSDDELDNVAGGLVRDIARTRWHSYSSSEMNNVNSQNSAPTNTNYELPRPKGLFNLF